MTGESGGLITNRKDDIVLGAILKDRYGIVMIYHKAVMIGSVTQSTNLKISEENEIDRVELRLDCSGG
jgi:hypothetical protein